MVARAIDRAKRGETAWSRKPGGEDAGDAARGELTITDAVLHYRLDSVDNALVDERGTADPRKRYVPRSDDGRPRRAERVWVEATVEGSDGGTEKIEIETDVAFLDPDEHWPTESGIALRADTRITVDELVELLVEACVQPREGERDDDSAETQRENFDDHALWVATTLLLPRKDARERQLENAVRRYGAGLLEEGEMATVTVAHRPGSNGRREVHATVSCA